MVLHTLAAGLDLAAWVLWLLALAITTLKAHGLFLLVAFPVASREVSGTLQAPRWAHSG